MVKGIKENASTLSLASVVSVICALGAVWATARPIVSTVLAQEVEKQIQPLADAFEITMSTTIRNLRSSIAAMEFKRDMCAGAPDCWTVRDAQELAAVRADLAAAEQALSRLRGSHQP